MRQNDQSLAWGVHSSGIGVDYDYLCQHVHVCTSKKALRLLTSGDIVERHAAINIPPILYAHVLTSMRDPSRVGVLRAGLLRVGDLVLLLGDFVHLLADLIHVLGDLVLLLGDFIHLLGDLGLLLGDLRSLGDSGIVFLLGGVGDLGRRRV